MGGAQCGVVSVRAKMPPVLGGIAANDISLRSGCFETIVFQYFRSDASLDKCIYLSDQTRIIDNVVLAALKGVVFERCNGIALDRGRHDGGDEGLPRFFWDADGLVS